MVGVYVFCHHFRNDEMLSIPLKRMDIDAGPEHSIGKQHAKMAVPNVKFSLAVAAIARSDPLVSRRFLLNSGSGFDSRMHAALCI